MIPERQNDGANQTALLKEQRDQALACLILGAAISVSVMLSVFGPQRQLESARAGVVLHEKLLEDAKKVLAENQKELASTKAALARMQ